MTISTVSILKNPSHLSPARAVEALVEAKGLRVWDSNTGQPLSIALSASLEEHRKSLPGVFQNRVDCLTSSLWGINERSDDYLSEISRSFLPDDVVGTPLWDVTIASEKNPSLPADVVIPTLWERLKNGATRLFSSSSEWKAESTFRERAVTLLRDEAATLCFDFGVKIATLAAVTFMGIDPLNHPLLFSSILPTACILAEKPIILANSYLDRLDKWDHDVNGDFSKPRFSETFTYKRIRESNLIPDIVCHDTSYEASSIAVNTMAASALAFLSPGVAVPAMMVLAPVIDTVCFVGAALFAAWVAPAVMPPVLAVTDRLASLSEKFSVPKNKTMQTWVSKWSRSFDDFMNQVIEPCVEGPYRSMMQKIEAVSGTVIDRILPQNF